MSVHPTLPALLESFFRNRLAKQRNASRSTIASYRDALRMLILFATEHTGRKPCALTIEDLDRDLILAFRIPTVTIALSLYGWVDFLAG